MATSGLFARVCMNEGELAVGDDILYVMVGSDIRPGCSRRRNSWWAESKWNV